MKIFLICPVRNVTKEFEKKLAKYIKKQEALGNKVHYPPRDTNQNDSTGLNICNNNMWAIHSADEIHIAWDGKSHGCLFDLGMAFSIRKRIVPIGGLFPDKTDTGKSFPNMVWDLDTRFKESKRLTKLEESNYGED